MRVAFFSPLPPSRSGIADYSEALVDSLRRVAEVEVFSRAGQAFHPERFDIAVYQVGNNVFHDFVYETALRHPGVVVMHESNLHHLLTELTIKRGDWDAYVAECEYNGGAAALAFAERVRKLEVGPDYEGVPMTRRLLASARGVIVHSAFVRDEMRAQGFHGPLATIPHGAWIPSADRNGYRYKLGLDETAPLIGIFGFLKPYKRIAESLRAFRRLVRLVPNARMILVGEPHPEFPVEALICSLGLSANVRLLGFTPIEEFVGYLGACDIVLNLRWPTVGESSGTLLRSLGLGKAVLVSEVGSFQEFPDDVCLKVPVGPGEEDLIFEYLNLLVSRPDVAQALGARAKDWVARECNWDLVAERYVGFLAAVVAGREWVAPGGDGTAADALDATPRPAAKAALAAVAEPVAPAGRPALAECAGVAVPGAPVRLADAAPARLAAPAASIVPPVPPAPAPSGVAVPAPALSGVPVAAPAPSAVPAAAPALSGVSVAAVPAAVAGRPEPPAATPDPRGELGEYLLGWAASEAARQYVQTHRTRLVKTLAIAPPGGADDRILEMGAYLQITPALHTRLGYGSVRGCYYGPLGRVDHREVESHAGERFACDVDLFDAEKDRFPYADGEFATIVCGELIEHLLADPMHLMSEVNRVLRPGGHFVLTTPNIASLRGLSAILQGYHPGFFPAFIKPAEGSGEVDARHNREYTAREIHHLLEDSGFAVTLLETGEFLDVPHPEFGWVRHLLERYRLPTDLRGDGIYAVGRKTGPVRERYPAWLYS
jgi:glycosyltransferase involved in cell wall biosynthesis/SAM-dependent methyltransferase